LILSRAVQTLPWDLLGEVLTVVMVRTGGRQLLFSLGKLHLLSWSSLNLVRFTAALMTNISECTQNNVQ
jgi:hypothetical protein